MRCAYCFADKGHYGRTIARFMSPQTATQCIDHIVDTYRRIEKVKIIGGEPLLNCNTLQSALDALRQVVSDGRLESMPKIILNTNLTVGVNRLSSLLRDYPMAITVSLDGPEYIHDEFRRFSNGKGSFQIVDSNIRSLLSTTGQRILLEVVYHPNHLEYGFAMPDVHSFLEERYGSVDVFLHPVSGGKASFKGADHQPTPDSWHRYTTQMFELSQSYGRFLVQDAINSNQLDHLINLFIDLMYCKRNDAHCDVAVKSLTISARGTVYPCYIFSGLKDFVMAHNCTPEQLASDRFSSVQQRFIANTKSGNPTCAQCDLLKTCHNCPGEMLRRMGALNTVQPIICDFRLGYAEGLMLGLHRLLADRRLGYLLLSYLNNWNHRLASSAEE
ncbi:MAG: radical SAM protein [Phycisphaerae bacterium]|nr:radical SAM protein [Phycisphaerae bacterium]